MKVLWLSPWAEGAYGALKLVAEGHSVKLWIKDPAYRKEVYTGLIDKVEAYQPYVSWCDFVVIDQNKMTTEWEFCSKSKPVFGGSEFGNMLEKDRKFAHEMMDYIGLKRLESQVFKTVKEAQNHIRKHKVKHVVKPFGGKTGSEDIIISEFENGEDAVALLHRFESRHIPFDGIEVEEKKDGIECALSAWCAGSLGFIGPIEANFEHKKIASGNIGYLTGEMGTAMTYISRDNKFFKATLSKIENVIKQLDYRGQLDISFIADKFGFWPLEFTPRLGYPALALNMALQKTPVGELLYGIASKKIKNNEVLDGWCIGVVVVSYGFPFSDEVKKKSTEYPILNVNESNIHHVNLYEAKAGLHDNDVPGLVTSAGMGIPLVTTGTGSTIQDAQKDCYEYLTGKDRIVIPNSYFRTDIGDRVIDKMSEIKSFGIL